MATASQNNLSVVLCGIEDVRFNEGQIPAAGNKEVVVAIRYCGICGTDLHLFEHGQAAECSPITPENPFYIGHECSGVVHTVGSDVVHLKKGDKVAVELGVSCRKCALCREGKGNLCKPWSQGGLSRYLATPADYCHLLPDSVTLEQGALMEPLAVTVRACQRAGVYVGANVLVCGAGTIGLCAMLTAKAMGAARVCITDICAWRLELASSLGADCSVLVRPDASADDVTDQILKEFGVRPDRTIECCGAPSSLCVALKVTATGGVIAPVAIDSTKMEVPVVDIITREIDVKGVFSYHGKNYPDAIAMVTSGKADPSPIITHRIKLHNVVEALKMLRSPPQDMLKVIVEL